MPNGDKSQQQFASIMIVEDDDDIRDTLSQIVELEGYKAVSAANGREALDKLRSHDTQEPCLILLDLMMPEMNGWEFLELRRKNDVLASIPVIVVSAAGESIGLPVGARKFMRKPVDLDVLLRDVRQYCHRCNGKAHETIQEQELDEKKKAA